MIAFQIRINGNVVLVAGQSDTSILHSNVVLSQGNEERGVDEYIRLTTSGLSQDTDKGYPEHFRWKDHDLVVGDSVEIEVVDVESIDAPAKRYRSDNIVQENPFTDEEIRELRHKDYVELKKEFEPEGAA